MCSDGGQGPGGAGGTNQNGGAPQDWLGGTPGFLWLVLSWEQKQKLGKLLVINQILAIW